MSKKVELKTRTMVMLLLAIAGGGMCFLFVYIVSNFYQLPWFVKPGDGLLIVFNLFVVIIVMEIVIRAFENAWKFYKKGKTILK